MVKSLKCSLGPVARRMVKDLCILLTLINVQNSFLLYNVIMTLMIDVFYAKSHNNAIGAVH